MSNILVCGRMKEGKTSFALAIAAKRKHSTIAWDPRHMIDEEMSNKAGFREIIYVCDGDELEEAIEQPGNGRLIVYRPSSINLHSDFEELCSVVLDPPEKYHNWTFVIDEAAQLQSSHSISPHLSRTIRQHPRSVVVIQTTHSLQDWHRASKDLVNHLFCFRLIGRSLRSVIEFCDGSEEMEETIKNLQPHHCVHISFESQAGAEEFSVITPESWYPAKEHARGPMREPEPEEEEEENSVESGF